MRFHLAALVVFALFMGFVAPLRPASDEAGIGAVSGRVIDPGTKHPIEDAVIILHRRSGDATDRTATSDRNGAFTVENVPFGEYKAIYRAPGAEPRETSFFTVHAPQRSLDLGELLLTPAVTTMEALEITTRQEAFFNSIDRKVYNVGKDIQSATGGASDLLQNIPSVQVDIEGNVSLRGSSDVLILIDGRPSTLMGSNRAAALEQMPADSIERIEVITNPSAKYKPDGTAGIINIVRKKNPGGVGYSGALRGSVGNDRRYNLGASGGLVTRHSSFSASYSIRQDHRERTVQDNRSHLDVATNRVVITEQSTRERSRPLSHIAQLGVEHAIDEDNEVGLSASYNYRRVFRTADDTNVTRDQAGTVSLDYDRLRTDPEFERDTEIRGTYHHAFKEEGHVLNLELEHDWTTEQEDNHYTNIYRTPGLPRGFDNTLIKKTETDTEALLEYVLPMDHDAKLEAGYTLENNNSDQDLLGTFLDPATGGWVRDTEVSNRFLYEDTLHALYTTYGRPFGKFGVLAGARMEQALIETHQLTSQLINRNDYFRFYPSLHLSYNLTDHQQLQLNYSHRVRRPDSDDLNPFPEYQDPYNLRAGNPYLRPEDIHSVEAGWQFKRDDTTYLAAVYFRHRVNSFTEITRFIDSVTLLTTHENLATSRSGGLEMAATTTVGKYSFNASANAFHNQIDASNLGYSASRSTVTWEGKLNVNYQAAKSTLVQLNTNYTAKRLTPQGDRLPTFVANIGLRHDLKDKNLSLVLTASDLFNSLKERTVVDTPLLQREITRRRSSRVVYVGFIYNFGKSGKKSKDDALEFDNQL